MPTRVSVQRAPSGAGWEWGADAYSHIIQIALIFEIEGRFRAAGGGGVGRDLGLGAAFSSALPFSGPESELQIALIALFSEMLYRFPNMVVAQVTRESVQQAIASGITAQQVFPFGGGRDILHLDI